MDVYTSEEQQIEAIKKWWQKNAKAIIGGIVLGLAIVFGGRAWMDYRSSHAASASIQYETMMTAMDQGMDEVALQQGGSIIGKYSDTPYAPLAELATAKIKLKQGDTTAARTRLRWALDNAKNAEIQNIARLRLARVMLNDGEYQQALALLGEKDPGGFLSAYEELKGDTYIALAKPDKARESYQKALNSLDPKSRDRSVLQMKLDDVDADNKAGDSQ